MSEHINTWIEQVLTEQLAAEAVLVGGDGRHFEITVVSSHFEGQRPVKKQQLVYAVLFAWGVAFYYSKRANSEFDAMARELVAEFEKKAKV